MEALLEVLSVKEPITTTNKVDSDDNNNVFKRFVEEHNTFQKNHPDLNNNTQLKLELGNLEKTHKDINRILKDVIPPLKTYLIGFNKGLSDFTDELGFIRKKSSELKNLLDYNSQKLASISPLVNDLIIPPGVINEIIHGKINSRWQDNIVFIKDKQQIYSKYKDTNKEELQLPIDFENLNELLDILRSIILERSKKFIISKLRTLRSNQPVPSQRVQKLLLQVKEIFQYIVENNYSLALEIRQAYAYTMKWYYKEYFSRYIRSLTILQFRPIDSAYSLGNVIMNENNSNGSSLASSLFSGYIASAYTGASAADNNTIKHYFQIDRRLSILTQEDNTVMVSQIAENNNTKNNYIETGFKNLNLAILDNCTAEYTFLKKFFQISDDESELSGVLEQIFQPVFDHSLGYTRDILTNQSVYDIFGVLISIRIANLLQNESSRRKIPIIDNHMNDQLIILWPKFQQLMDWQSVSLTDLQVTQLVIKESLSTPSELTIQFSIFLQSLLTLTSHGSIIDELRKPDASSDDNIDHSRAEPLYNSIIRVRNDYETVMTKLSKLSKEPEKFLSVNYLYILNSLQQQLLSLQENEVTEKDSIIKETENHFMTLVEAYNQQN